MASNATYFATATLLSLVVSCAAPKVVVVQRDSMVIHVKDSISFRDSVILVPIPEGADKAMLPDTDTSYLETSVAKSTAFIDEGGRICHTLTNKSDAIIPIRVTIPEKIHTEEKGLTRYLKEVERVEVKKELSRWQNFIMSLGYAILIAGALWLVWKLSRIISFS